jgi:endonuclease/exonuclease/phosphatase (EEP) superfamily protein YafD
MPIDHLYAGPNWTANKVSSFRMPGSDHFAIEAVLVRR